MDNNSSFSYSIIEISKRKIRDKFHSTLKIFFWEEVMRLIYSLGFIVVILWAFYYQKNISFGRPPNEKNFFIFLGIIILLINLTIIRRLIQTHRVIKEIEEMRDKIFHLDQIYDLIFKFYSKRNLIPDKFREGSMKERTDNDLMIKTLHRELKEYTFLRIVINLMFIFMVFIQFEIIVFQIVFGAAYLTVLVFDCLQYVQSKKWINLCLDLKQWEISFMNFQSMEKKSTIRLLEEDFDRFDSPNNGDQI